MGELSLRRTVSSALGVAGLTALWIAGVVALALAAFFRMLDSADPVQPGEQAVHDPGPGVLELVLAAVLVGGPLLIAALARWWRAPGVPRAYVVVAVVAALPALLVGVMGWRDLRPEPLEAPPPPPSSRCAEHSGGANTCPGG
ncbi:hypothetical protein KZZ52_46550 [Dactylosporangium sp. AC04546]|uniref:hypothetical protein n=1 Tax=Dactylosporangium sp. AC04546 TaxID=2862460 RepID=UPI001EDDDA1C|nr:hypothetical protein [Dactylosporangium sp. AC04546]WVK81375.1 hypothetical protein KZZ52_46550 [Dactylosporangium sp. AC04546]